MNFFFRLLLRISHTCVYRYCNVCTFFLSLLLLFCECAYARVHMKRARDAFLFFFFFSHRMSRFCLVNEANKQTKNKSNECRKAVLLCMTLGCLEAKGSSGVLLAHVESFFPYYTVKRQETDTQLRKASATAACWLEGLFSGNHSRRLLRGFFELVQCVFLPSPLPHSHSINIRLVFLVSFINCLR